VAEKLQLINLHNHTEYSILDGMISPDELIDYAVENNQPAIAMTDHGTMGGFLKVYKKAKEEGVKALLGCELYLVKDIDFQQHRKKGEKEQRYHLTAIAKNFKGLQNLFKLSTKGHLEGFYYRPRVSIEWVKKHSEGVIFMSGCMAGPIGQLVYRGKKEIALKQTKKFDRMFEDFYLEIQPNDIKEQVIINQKLVEISHKTGVPLVATSDAHYLKEQRETHPVLLGINSGGKMWSFDDNCFHLMTGKEMFNLMKTNHPKLDEKDIIDSINNTVTIAEKVEDFELPEYHNIIPKPYPELKTEEDEYQFLLELVEKGWAEKNMLDKKEKPEYQKRLKTELNTIKKLGFVRYFLVVYELYENFVKPEGIMYGTGRGSAAGSLVCCLLDITNPDPIEYDLIFERFISPDRVTSPDIDADFEDERRDEIKKYLYEKYGKDCAASIGTYGTLKGKQVLRDVSRVFNVPRKEVDKISNLVIQRSGGDERSDQTLIDTFNEFDEAKKFGKKYSEVPRHCDSLEGRIRQTGIHAAGVAVAPFPLTDVMPLEIRGGQNGTVVTALDGKEIDKMGFLKLDILGLRTLTICKDVLDQVGLSRKDLVDLDYNDQKVFDKFASGETEGVFQFHSQGMSDILQDMPVNDFSDLVALNALYRPGGMRSGICGDYIDRKKGKKYEEVGNVYDKITKDTFGLVVYQEQIMAIFGKMAGYSPTNIDHMRKRVAKSHGVEEFTAQKPKFIKGCKGNGIDEDFANEIFDKMVHFGSYAFNKSHALVYTQIAYWTQWLKTYYPLEFFIATLNHEPDDSQLKKALGELESMGYELLLPHINKSKTDFSVEEVDGEKKVRCGLRFIKGIGEKTANCIVEHQPYECEEDITENDDIDNRTFHKGIRRLLNKIGAWEEHEGEEKEQLRETMANEEFFPFPVMDKNIKKLRKMTEVYNADFVDIENLEYDKTEFIYLRGIFSGIDYARVGDFGPPSPYSKWELGQRYCLMDLVDGTAHTRIKFNPEKYEKYKDMLKVGKMVVIHARMIKDIKMGFVDFMFEVTEEKVKKHKKKYGE